MSAACTPVPHTRESLLTALAEAVRDRDERTLRRLLARFAEQATLTDLTDLRDALDPAPAKAGPHCPSSQQASGCTATRHPGAARLVLVDGVVHLNPETAVLKETLDGRAVSIEQRTAAPGPAGTSRFPTRPRCQGPHWPGAAATPSTSPTAPHPRTPLAHDAAHGRMSRSRSGG